MGFLWGGFKRQVQHYKNYGYFKEFFDYPLHHIFEYIFTQDRIKAELFARLGVFYFAHPEVLKRELPQSYEVYHELFGISQSSPHDGAYVRPKVWSASRGVGALGGNNWTNQENGRNDGKSLKGQPTNHELGLLISAIAKTIKAPIGGRKGNF